MTAPKKPTTSKRQPAKKPAGKASPESSASDGQDASTRHVPEPELEVEAPADWNEAAQEDYQAGADAAKRGWPVRACPHPQESAQRHAWLKGYHAYAHPQSNSTVVPEDGNTNGGVYRGTY